MDPDKTMRRYRAIKYTLFIFCYVFWVTSAVLIAVGTYAKVAKEKDIVDTLTVDPALVVMAVGSIMFLLTFFGCCGALRNISCLLKTFLGILVVILLVQVAAAVLGYLFTDKVIDRTEKFMRKAIVRYRDDMDLENVIDFVQKKFQCCGVQSYKDWSENVYFQCSDENPSVEACGVPFSCCLKTDNQTVLNTMCGYGVQEVEQREAAADIHTAGCLSSILTWARTNVLLVGGLTAGLLLLEVCMISLAAAQVSRIKKVGLQKKLSEEHRGASRSRERKDSYWYPAHPFDDE